MDSKRQLFIKEDNGWKIMVLPVLTPSYMYGISINWNKNENEDFHLK